MPLLIKQRGIWGTAVLDEVQKSILIKHISLLYSFSYLSDNSFFKFAGNPSNIVSRIE